MTVPDAELVRALLDIDRRRTAAFARVEHVGEALNEQWSSFQSALPNTTRSSPFARSRTRRLRAGSVRPARLIYRFRIDIAAWNGLAFRRVLTGLRRGRLPFALRLVRALQGLPFGHVHLFICARVSMDSNAGQLPGVQHRAWWTLFFRPDITKVELHVEREQV